MKWNNYNWKAGESENSNSNVCWTACKQPQVPTAVHYYSGTAISGAT